MRDTSGRGNEDSPRILEETRQYIHDFDRIAEAAKAPRELYDQMLKLHPLCMNVNALWTSALAIKGWRPELFIKAGSRTHIPTAQNQTHRRLTGYASRS